MRLQRGLVREQVIERTIEPILVDLPHRRAAADRQAPCGDTSPRRCAARSTARTAAPSPAPPPSSPRRPVPGPAAAAARTAPRAPSRATRRAPGTRRRTGASARPGSPFSRTGTVSCRLPSSNSRACFRRADQPARQRARLNPPVLIELAKLRHRLLNHPPPDTNAAHQTPVAMNLAVLLANRVAQVHAPSEPTSAPRKYPRSALHAQISLAALQLLDPTSRHLAQNREIHPQTAQVGLALSCLKPQCGEASVSLLAGDNRKIPVLAKLQAAARREANHRFSIPSRAPFTP